MKPQLASTLPTWSETPLPPEVKGLEALDRQFQAAMVQRRQTARHAIKEGEHPLWIRTDESLIFVSGRWRRECEVSSTGMQHLSNLRAIPVAVFTGLKNADSRSIALVRSRLASLVGRMPAVLCRDSVDVVQRACMRLIEKAAPTKGLRTSDLRAFHNKLGPAFKRLIALAVTREVRSLSSAMRQIQLTLPPQSWSRTYCVVCAGNQPQYKRLTQMYFERWLALQSGFYGDPRHRVLHSDCFNNLGQAIDTVAQHLVSGRADKIVPERSPGADPDSISSLAEIVLDQHFSQTKG